MFIIQAFINEKRLLFFEKKPHPDVMDFSL